MALSPSHRFGQIIGDVLEEATLPLLQRFANEHGLYLDKKGDRPCRSGQKCSWKDLNGNTHDLDYVLERDGTPQKVGTPVAFIEAAWRRYTKHSRNKAQEIQGAIGPLLETYRNAGPFPGVILAGIFTEGALTQLRSLGFTVLYFPYQSVVEVFRRLGIDAAFDEDTPDAELQRKVDAFEQLPAARRRELADALLEAHRADVRHFIKALTAAVSRRIERILVLPLHGKKYEVSTVDDAVKLIQQYDGKADNADYVRYEIIIRYSNGDKIEATFHDKESAIKYLRST